MSSKSTLDSRDRHQRVVSNFVPHNTSYPSMQFYCDNIANQR